MNTTALNGKRVRWPLLKRAEPKPAPVLTLTQRIDTPWLAIRERLDPAIASSVVLIDGAQGFYIDDEAVTFRAPFNLPARGLIPLTDFGVFASLYAHTRVVSFVKGRLGRRAWTGPRVDRIRVSRLHWDRVAEAVKSLNAEMGVIAHG